MALTLKIVIASYGLRNHVTRLALNSSQIYHIAAAVMCRVGQWLAPYSNSGRAMNLAVSHKDGKGHIVTWI